jgi:hypothetical protein
VAGKPRWDLSGGIQRPPNSTAVSRGSSAREEKTPIPLSIPPFSIPLFETLTTRSPIVPEEFHRWATARRKVHRSSHDRRENQLMPNVSKSQRTEANIYSIECRSGGEADGCSCLEVLRSNKAERLIERKNGWSRFIDNSPKQ